MEEKKQNIKPPVCSLKLIMTSHRANLSHFLLNGLILKTEISQQ